MRKVLLLLMALVLPVVASAQERTPRLVVWQKSGDKVCTLEIDEVDGGSSYTEVGRRCDTAEHLAELLAKLIKKSK